MDGLDSTLERQRTSQSDDIASNRRSEDNGKFEGEFDQLRLSPRPSTDRENPRVDICEAGSIRGEDYFFQFTGKIKDGKLHFRLHMQYEGDDSGDENQNAVQRQLISYMIQKKTRLMRSLRKSARNLICLQLIRISVQRR